MGGGGACGGSSFGHQGKDSSQPYFWQLSGAGQGQRALWKLPSQVCAELRGVCSKAVARLLGDQFVAQQISAPVPSLPLAACDFV